MIEQEDNSRWLASEWIIREIHCHLKEQLQPAQFMRQRATENRFLNLARTRHDRRIVVYSTVSTVILTGQCTMLHLTT